MLEDLCISPEVVVRLQWKSRRQLGGLRILQDLRVGIGCGCIIFNEEGSVAAGFDE